MNRRKRRSYPYSLDDYHATSVRPGKKKRRVGRFLALGLLMAILGGLGFMAIRSLSSEDLASYLPFPKRLIALRFQHNNNEVVLLPDTQCVVNPRDSLQFLEAQTDGWVSWGVKVVAADLDVEEIREKPVLIRDLFPDESFETPKTLELRTLLWNRPIGKVSFLVQLDAKDWLQKANTTSDTDRKIVYLEKALQENSGNILVKTQLAGLYFDAKRYDDAVRFYKEINESGKSRSVLERLLAVYQQQNQVEDALVTYLELLRLSEDPELFKEFLQYLQKRKPKEEVGKFLERHQAEIPKAFYSSVQLFLADLNIQTKNWSKAASAYERMIKAGVKDPDILYNLAVTYQQNDDQGKAIQAMERYLQKNSGDLKSWIQLGELYEKKGTLAKARGAYETVLQKNPQHKEAQVRLISLLGKINDKGALQDAYEKLAQQQPKNKTVNYNLAILYYEAKKWDKAAEAFEILAALDGKDQESRKYLLDIYRKQKNEKGEMETLQCLTHLDPKNKAYHDELFSIYEEKKDYKGMIAHFRNAVEQQPDSAAFHNYLLYAYLKTGDSKGALKELDQLSRLQPKEKKHLRQAAHLHETTGDYSGALKKVDQILKLDPKDKEAKDDYLRLKMLIIGKKKPA